MVQVVEQTHEEKVKMYNKLPKKELINMLINCNNMIKSLTENKTIVMPLSSVKTFDTVEHKHFFVERDSIITCSTCGEFKSTSGKK